MIDYKILKELGKNEDNSAQIIKQITQNKIQISDIIKELSSERPRVKYKSAKILSLLSAEQPEMLYPFFDFFVKLLDNNNNILKWNAIDIIANLVPIDYVGSFNRVFDKLFRLFNEGNLITSAHVVENSAKIIKAKPDLESEITRKLLLIAQIPLPTEECRSIIYGKTIKAFSDYFNLIGNKKMVFKFVKDRTGDTRPATRKKAEQFIKKYALS